MKLHRKQRQAPVLHALNAHIVKIYIYHLHTLEYKGVAVYRIAVVLRHNERSAGFPVKYSMVAAPVSEFELVGFAAHCKRKHLMSHTNTENRKLADKSFYGFDALCSLLRISRPVCKEKSVR